MWLRELLLNKLFLTVNLIKACRSISPNVKIIISAIIPRPVDHDVTDHIIGKINSYLHNTLSSELKFKFILYIQAFYSCWKSQKRTLCYYRRVPAFIYGRHKQA